MWTCRYAWHTVASRWCYTSEWVIQSFSHQCMRDRIRIFRDVIHLNISLSFSKIDMKQFQSRFKRMVLLEMPLKCLSWKTTSIPTLSFYLGVLSSIIRIPCYRTWKRPARERCRAPPFPSSPWGTFGNICNDLNIHWYLLFKDCSSRNSLCSGIFFLVLDAE